MNVGLKKRWVAALRSGKYKQVKNGLRRDNGFCCLGVLCDLIDPSKWDSLNRYDGRMAFIPSETRTAIRLSDDNENRLSEMNDRGKTFAQIASYIEKRKTL